VSGGNFLKHIFSGQEFFVVTRRGNFQSLKWRSLLVAQSLECFTVRIQFAGDDGLMFLPGDGTLVLELNFRPLPFYDDRPLRLVCSPYSAAFSK
jgi:hypothetical protein